MITATEIRNQREKEFKETFDFEAFDKYLEDYFIRDGKNHLYIGLEYREYIVRWNSQYLSKCNDLSFDPKGRHYLWSSKIQISHEVSPFVEKYLYKNGFHTTQKGACGYDKFDVMVVSL